MELAAMEKNAVAATKALDDVIALYARWMKEHPKSAVYPYASALLIDPKEDARRERLLLQAVELDPKLTEAYSLLMGLANGIDDDAALKYAKKALDSKPDDVNWQLTYARMLWPVDQGAARRYYAGFQQKHAGTKDGASGLQQFISAVEDPAEKTALVERFRRDYPTDWTPDYSTNNDVFGSYVSYDPQKGLDFAKEILVAIEAPKPGSNGKTTPPPEYLKTRWVRNVEYAQAVVDARKLISEKKGADAIARLENVTVPGSVDDEAQLDVLRAGATAATGDVARAYDMLLTSLAADINEGAQEAILGYGAKLGKSPKQVDDEVWARRMQKAETFKEFDLAKLGGGERVRLSDFRGKVVLVDSGSLVDTGAVWSFHTSTNWSASTAPGGSSC
jgi:hypothetical protein